MRTIVCLSTLVLALLASPAGADMTTERPVVAQSESRCGLQPMKPMSCLNGTWVCRCSASGQICEWELIGCQITPSIPKPTGDGWPGMGTNRPDTFNR